MGAYYVILVCCYLVCNLHITRVCVMLHIHMRMYKFYSIDKKKNSNITLVSLSRMILTILCFVTLDNRTNDDINNDTSNTNNVTDSNANSNVT